MKTLCLLPALCLAAVLAACQKQPDNPPPPSEAPKAETPPPQTGKPPVAPPPPTTQPAQNTAVQPTPPPAATAQGSSLSAQSSSLSGSETGFNIEINLSSDVLFDFDKAELKPEADAELQKAADIIRQKGKGLIAITGHTDGKGSDAYNRKLSLARAEAVKKWFESQGLQQNYQTEGAGASKPVAPNTNADGSDNPEGRAKNRRVEIIVNKTKRLGDD